MNNFTLNRRILLTGALLVSGRALSTHPGALAQDATPAPSAFEPAPLPEAEPREEGAISIIATTPILADIARQVGGVRVAVESLLPANSDPHDFEPAPQDIVKIEVADIVVEHGMNLDSWASNLVENAGSKTVVIATNGVVVLPSKEEGFASGDPHVWFDPMNVKIMAANIALALTTFDPLGADAYAHRLAAYQSQLDALDLWIMEQLATVPAEHRKLVTNHDAFGYYVNRYGLTFVGSVIPSLDSRAEPSAREIADLIERIKAEAVPAIFTETSLNPELETELAKQAGVKIIPDLYSDTLGSEGSGAETYIGLMVVDTLLIVNALRSA